MSNSTVLNVFKKIVLHRFFFLFVDAFIVFFSYIASLWLINEILPSGYSIIDGVLTFVVPATIISIFVFFVCRFYSNLWEFSGIHEVHTLFKGVLISLVPVFVYGRVVALLPHSKFMYLAAATLELGLLCISRLGYKYFYRFFSAAHIPKRSNLRRTMIVGAGRAGHMILREIRSNNHMNLSPVVFIDDDKSKHGQRIGAVAVYGGREDIPTAVDKFNIQQIIIAIPSAPPHTIREIAEICTGLSADVKIMPEINKMLMNKPVILRDLDIHDFLSREEVTLDNETIADTIHGKRVLITGGGGSIGSEICRQIARFTPEELIIFDIYENNAYELQQELSRTHKELKVTVLIGSVRDEARLESVFNTYKPHIVFHAAAHKHVPLMEHSPAEAVKNNIFGTLNVAVASDKHNVSSFVLISTDKAVNPTNVMGATKRVAEMIIQHMNERSDTRFVAVRFGNVLGSNGSVVPLFQKQIESGGPVLVTHPDIVRFFMTIPEAAQLVLQACSMANGGEIFILDMGNPVKIDDLARKMITLSGNTPDVDIKIVYTGLRPGEKLYEELLLSEEGITATKHKKIYTAKPGAYDEELIKTVNTLNELISNPEALVSKIEEIIGQKLKH